MPDPKVRELLIARVDDLTGRIADLIAEVREVTEQLHPERARSCGNAITMASVMVDEIRLRAHAQPLDEPPGRGGTPTARTSYRKPDARSAGSS
jgi:hypothetical protein